MSIEKITSKIISDAKGQAEITLNEAKVKCDGILAEAASKAEAMKKQAEIDGREEKEKLILRRKAVADIDGRKIVLAEKQKLIAACFDEATERIVSMEKGAYIDFLVGLVKKTGETEGSLLLNAKDAERVGNDLLAAIEKEIPGSKITLSNENRNIKGGFLLKKGDVYINGTVESLIDEARDALVAEVAAQLFQ